TLRCTIEEIADWYPQLFLEPYIEARGKVVRILFDPRSAEKVPDAFFAPHKGRPMASPFPGMDPYLEAHWRDVHARLVVYACDALQGVLPTALRARVEESVLLETPTGIGDHPLYPDVRVFEYTSKRLPVAPRNG